MNELAELCHRCFEPSTNLARHANALRAPGSLSNVFFNVVGEASVAVLRQDGKAVGCAQLVPCELRSEASELDRGRRAFWAQYICVDKHYRRSGAATRLMHWCQDEAAASAQGSQAESAEIWLAVILENKAAIELYNRLGFSSVHQRRGHLVMRKKIPAAAESVSSPRGPASRFDVLECGGISIKSVLAQILPSLTLGFVALFGICAVLAPLAYRASPTDTLFQLFFKTGQDSQLLFINLAADIVIGLAAAIFAELCRRLFNTLFFSSKPTQQSKGNSIINELIADPSLAAQKESLWRITGGAAAAPLTSAIAIIFWQLGAVLSEELYYRGLLLHAFQRLALAATAPTLTANILALVVSTALFALAHADWAQADGTQYDNNDQREKRGAEWFLQTAPFGALFALLCLLTSDRILAPIITHLTLNVAWCLADLNDLRQAPRAQLASVFDDLRSSRQEQMQQQQQSSSSF